MSEPKIPRKYKATESEEKWRAQWEEWGIHKWDPTRPREETFIVDTPPPTVSGSLHIGHVFSYSHQDLIVRYQRMQGKNIFYPMGWDDNGLPTERRVQNVFGIKCDPSLPYDPDWKPSREGGDGPAEEVSRPNFIEACGIITEEDEQAFENLWRRLGLSIDWAEQYATIDDHCRRISQMSFLDLVEKDLVYQTESPTMWDVDFQTAVAQAEVEDREKPGHMHDIRFGIEDGGEFIISTTRPELLAACIAVVAHPDDERYQDYFGRHAVTPIFGARVPILAAEHADPEKGTGILMVCTFGDAADVDWWKQSDLPIKQVIGMTGRLLPVQFGEPPFESVDCETAQSAWKELEGLTTAEARRKMVDLLRQPGSAPDGDGTALKGEPEPLMHPVKHYEKGERPLEFIPTRQWFIKILEHQDALLEQGRKIEWHPPHMRNRYESWVEGLNQDWCISRQRYFGVPFPVWYPLNDQGEPDYAEPILPLPANCPVDPQSDPPPGYDAEQRGKPGGFIGDPDVMDTWATSSLTPEIMSHWRLVPERHEKLFPMSIRPQAHEIIRTWAFYTIVKAWMHENEIPWTDVVISGWVLAPEKGGKISKSKGGIDLTPHHLMDEHTVDAVRYWAGRARLGTDTAFDESVLKVGKRLTTKIFHASRFVLGQVERAETTVSDLAPEAITEPLDRAFVQHLSSVVDQATAAFERFDYALALQVSEDAFWSFCDHYLELVKGRSYGDEGEEARTSALAGLAWSLKTFLRLLAPFIPFVTEEIWSWRFAGDGRDKSIHTTSWPTTDEVADVEPLDADGAFPAAVEVTSAIRGAKTDAQKSLRWPVEHLVIEGPEADLARLKPTLPDVLNAGKVNEDGVELQEGPRPEDAAFTVTVTLGEED